MDNVGPLSYGDNSCQAMNRPTVNETNEKEKKKLLYANCEFYVNLQLYNGQKQHCRDYNNTNPRKQSNCKHHHLFVCHGDKFKLNIAE